MSLRGPPYRRPREQPTGATRRASNRGVRTEGAGDGRGLMPSWGFDQVGSPSLTSEGSPGENGVSCSAGVVKRRGRGSQRDDAGDDTVGTTGPSGQAGSERHGVGRALGRAVRHPAAQQRGDRRAPRDLSESGVRAAAPGRDHAAGRRTLHPQGPVAARAARRALRRARPVLRRHRRPGRLLLPGRARTAAPLSHSAAPARHVVGRHGRTDA